MQIKAYIRNLVFENWIYWKFFICW